ncbi:hypothetical protein GIB67_023273, partial [Kingdonia uniflora]
DYISYCCLGFREFIRNYCWVCLQIAGTNKFAKVIDFLCQQLHRDTLFVYVNSAFSPNPDELVIALFL